MDEDSKTFENVGPFLKFMGFCFDLIDKPVTWVRENIVVPNRQEYYWYHEKLRRVPTIDECYTDDQVCIYEAEEQYKRDRSVDKQIVAILRKRLQNCMYENAFDDMRGCESIRETYNRAATNYFIKYGDLGIKTSALNCYMKQKNRMAWERRHGPVGSGRKPAEDEV